MTQLTYHDRRESEMILQAQNAYEGLVIWLKSTDDINYLVQNIPEYSNQVVTANKFLPALQVMIDQENKIKKLEEKIKEYEDFFETLGKFIPAQKYVTPTVYR